MTAAWRAFGGPPSASNRKGKIAVRNLDVESRKIKQLKRGKVTEMFEKDKRDLWPKGKREAPIHSTLADFYRTLKRGKA